MVAIHMEYQGDLHCKVLHSPSGTVLTTDAPKDNQGRGESFSPTDLVGAALGSCILSVMGIMARSLKLDISGATAHVPHRLTPEQQQRPERAALTCPVHKSMHPEVQMPIDFTWG